jgi:hypothetical protein
VKVTKKLREEAAVLCSAAAAYGVAIPAADDLGRLVWRWEWHRFYGVLWLADQFDFDDESALLAELAMLSISDRASITCETWAEAEALLRCGFVPEGWES